MAQLNDTLWPKLIGAPKVKAAHQKAKTAQAALDTAHKEVEPLLRPANVLRKEAKQSLADLAADSPSAAKAELESGGAKDDKQSRDLVMLGLRKRLDGPFRKVVAEAKALVEAGRTEAASLRTQVEADEAALAAEWGLTNAPGRLSAACDVLDRRLAAMSEQIEISLSHYEAGTHRPASPAKLSGLVESFAG